VTGSASANGKTGTSGATGPAGEARTGPMAAVLRHRSQATRFSDAGCLAAAYLPFTVVQ
jgi:hypothetical protein